MEYEYWTPITDQAIKNIIPNRYVISNFGRVFDRHENTFVKIYYNKSNGYYSVRLKCTDNSAVYIYLHRLVLLVFDYNDNYKELQGNHINGDKSANSIYNLEWATPQQNSQHAVDNKLNDCSGEKCTFAKITEKEARKICELRIKNIPINEIAKIVGCSNNIVECIVQGTTWRVLYEEYNLDKYKQKKVYRSDDDIIRICEYLQANKNKYNTKKELFESANRELFGIDRPLSNSERTEYVRILDQQIRKDITKKYDFS